MGKKSNERRDQSRTVANIFDLIEDGASDELADVAERSEVKYLKDGEEEWLERRPLEGSYEGVSSGYPAMDKLMGSFAPGELFTIGGDTGHGKSLLAMNMAQNAYRQYNLPVLMVNLELTEDQARNRFYEISAPKHDYDGIMVQAHPAVSYRDIDTLMRRAKEDGACLVIIDHLHFFSRSTDNSTSELSRIMKHFKECAVQRELPIVLLSHVTPQRIMDEQGNVKKIFKPGLHSFKGSSSIEQDSDMVGFVFRDETKDINNIEFYMRKNRSRQLQTNSVFLKQEGWILKDASWVPKQV